MGLLRRIRAILKKAPLEQDRRDVVIEQQDWEIGRLRDGLTRHKGVHRENSRLQRRVERLERENEHLKQQSATERRAGRRQAAPLAKKRPQGRRGRPGRRPGTRYGRQGHRACPAHVTGHMLKGFHGVPHNVGKGCATVRALLLTQLMIRGGPRT